MSFYENISKDIKSMDYEIYDDFIIKCAKDADRENRNKNNNKKRRGRKRKRSRSVSDKPNIKKSKTENEIMDLIFIKKNGDEDELSSSSEDKPKIKCPNPLCDHKEYTAEELEVLSSMPKSPPIEVTDINDLIELGKTYHCKKNTVYFGINLRILCNLVSPLTALRNLVGMKNVKENIVNQIVFFLQGFNQKERCGNCVDCIYDLPCPKNLNNDMLHTVITGPPGVGKTELGKILGKVYKGMGVLSIGDLFIARRSDLVGKYLGHTAAKTQAFIDKCKGSVMFVDEAYSLGNPEKRDSFAKECIDTINQNLTEKRDFLCIIAGYKDSLDKCFFSYNEGLKRRFTFRYDVNEYSPDELMQIFLLKVHNEGWSTEFDSKISDNPEIALEKNSKKEILRAFFKKNMKYFPHFGGDVETYFLNCKIVHGRRMLFKDSSLRRILIIDDMKNGFEKYVNDRKYKETTDELSISQQMMYL